MLLPQVMIRVPDTVIAGQPVQLVADALWVEGTVTFEWRVDGEPVTSPWTPAGRPGRAHMLQVKLAAANGGATSFMTVGVD